MLQRPLGNSGLSVSALGFGAGHIGDPRMDDAEAGRLLNQALDLGITLIDTAPSYGLSEERIGRHLAHRRDEFVLATKCGYGIEGVPDWTGACITAGVDRALRVLQTDRIDVMLFHSCPRHVLEHSDVIPALEAQVQAGKVRVAGYSGENEDLAYAVTSGRFGAVETSVNLFDQASLTRTVPEALERGMGVIAKRPLANAPWRFAERPHGHYAEVYWERMQQMALDPAGLEWAEYALRFTAFQPGVASAIMGTAQLENLAANVRGIERGPLPEGLERMIREAFAPHGHAWVGQV